MLHLTDLIFWCLFVCLCVPCTCAFALRFKTADRTQGQERKKKSKLQFDPDRGIQCQLNSLPLSSPPSELLSLTVVGFLSYLSSSSYKSPSAPSALFPLFISHRRKTAIERAAHTSGLPTNPLPNATAPDPTPTLLPRPLPSSTPGTPAGFPWPCFPAGRRP